MKESKYILGNDIFFWYCLNTTVHKFNSTQDYTVHWNWHFVGYGLEESSYTNIYSTRDLKNIKIGMNIGKETDPMY